MTKETWVPQDIPLDKSNVARVYDYLLGGHHNFEIDRKAGRRMEEVYPFIRQGVFANRGFLCRAVEYVVRQGIRQFIDLGSGIPTVGNVHEVAQDIAWGTRVVYVDIDRVAVAHSRAMLIDNPNATAIRADAAYPRRIIDHEEVQALIDFEEPLGLLGVSIFHMIIDDERLDNLVHEWKQMMASGSYFVIAHPTYDEAPQEAVKEIQRIHASRSGAESKMRSLERLSSLLDDFEMIEPGWVHPPLWRPIDPDAPLRDEPEKSLAWAGVGRKP